MSESSKVTGAIEVFEKSNDPGITDLKRGEAVFRDLFENAPCGYLIIGIDGLRFARMVLMKPCRSLTQMR